jgi:hypothetical protein
VVDHFLCFHEDQLDYCEETLSHDVQKYLEHERKPPLNRKSSTLRGRFSCIKKFWYHTQRGDLAAQQTLVESNFAKWDKKDVTKQSKVLLKENFGTYYCIICTTCTSHTNKFYSPVSLLQLPRTKDSILWKAVAYIGNCFAARGGELMSLTWKDVRRCIDSVSKEPCYKIAYRRLKKCTSNSTDTEWALLSCPLGVGAVDDYISCFPDMTSRVSEARRFWLRLTQTGEVISGTANAQHIGKNVLNKIGCSIAAALSLPQPELCTLGTYSGAPAPA